MHKLPRTSFFLIVVVNLVVLGALAGSGCGDKGGAGGSSDGKDAAKYMGGAPPGMAKPGAASSGASSGAAAKTPPGPSPGGAPR
jgi:hypothetical protein